ncbi:FCSD flavin-binding domain-containing protein [Roseovarius arcticus]|uniref:FCSD flavin-binding domain-containing protein n=1 Tax=Roseovarius arcticus TaxID=2547404 RepID=UPI00111096FB|nr:FCSD flavin-binding domain-containing protein [Roseovarius arcticus]
MKLSRRSFSSALAAGAFGSLAAPAQMFAQQAGAGGRVVIVGGGFGGATCAKYLRRANPDLNITLVEQNPQYVTCPFSNTVIAGMTPLSAMTVDYARLRDGYNINVVADRATGIDTDAGSVSLAEGQALSYDRLVLAPGIATRFDAIDGYDEAAMGVMPHAWKAGPQTQLLRDQIQAMEDGGTVIVAIPTSPFRCPPGPYERVSLIAHYLKQSKPRSKVLILDANDGFAKQALFEEGWSSLYPGMIERVQGAEFGRVTGVDVGQKTLICADGSRHVGDVLNLIPPEKAGAIAEAAGLIDQSGWCPADPTSLVVSGQQNIHVIGDAASTGLPKSATIANSEAKVCAAAIGALMQGDPVGDPVYINACYSLLAPEYAISVAAMYEVKEGKVAPIENASGTSPLGANQKYRGKEAKDAHGWYASIVADTFT